MSLIIRNKKGALQLSINAIVVLILAITMLGLGLGFMRNMFSKTTGQFDDISDSMKNQVIDEIKSGNDKVIMNKYDIELKKSDTKFIYYGIKNVETGSKNFNIAINCTSSMSGDAGTNIKFTTFNTATIGSADIKVLKADVSAVSNAAATTYACAIVVRDQADTAVVWGQKDFYVTLV